MKHLRQIAKLRNISTNLSKSDIIYALICSKPIINEEKYIFDNVNEVLSKTNDVRLLLSTVSPYVNKKKHDSIRKRLYEIENTRSIDRKLKNRLLKELESMSIDLKVIQKRMISAYRDDNYANIDDIEYIFGDIDNYYAPVLSSSLFNNGYQRYHFRGDPMRNMSVKEYLSEIEPYLRQLIDVNKVYEQKIQLDIGFNMIHIDDKRRITHFSRSDVICMPSSDTNKILNELLTSLYEKYQEDLQLSRTSSSFSYESVEECNIHFNKIDLRRGASYIETPKWLKSKKATINPKNTHDVYCFMHAITIALYHNELGTNPERISKKLLAYAQKFNWHEIDFPACFADYAIFEKLNEDIALNVLYVPFNEVNICPEYISKRNFTTKNQITLLKITDESDKWHFLALPSILDDDGAKRPTKSLSRLMEGISSKSHGDYYCYGCLHSFCTQSSLKKHIELCKHNDFCKIKLPEEGKNIK